MSTSKRPKGITMADLEAAKKAVATAHSSVMTICLTMALQRQGVKRSLFDIADGRYLLSVNRKLLTDSLLPQWQATALLNQYR